MAVDRHIEREVGYLIVAATSHIYNEMDARGITKTELAERLGVSKPYITQLLDGETNMTLKTMVEVADAIGFSWDVRPFKGGKR